MRDDGVQQHAAVVGKRVVHLLEELGVGLEAEVFERADHEHPIELAVKLLPSLEADLFGSVPGKAGE